MQNGDGNMSIGVSVQHLRRYKLPHTCSNRLLKTDQWEVMHFPRQAVAGWWHHWLWTRTLQEDGCWALANVIYCKGNKVTQRCPIEKMLCAWSLRLFVSCENKLLNERKSSSAWLQQHDVTRDVNLSDVGDLKAVISVPFTSQPFQFHTMKHFSNILGYDKWLY